VQLPSSKSRLALDQPLPSTPEAAAWWGTFDVPLGGAGYWHVGMLRWWAQRFDHEWRISWRTGNLPHDRSVTVEVPSSDEPPPDAETNRFGFTRPPEQIIVSAALADRPVVIRPEKPFWLLPGEQASLYFTTPIWVRFELPGRKHQLLEVPTNRPSDTWFGSSTLTGELCYASRTRASLSLGAVAQMPGRAVTVATVKNDADDSVLLQRINLPLPHLALYRDDDGRHWTQSVEIVRRAVAGAGEVRLLPGVPLGCKSPTLASTARQPPPRGSILKAFVSLIA
jgi:hypothetical protein